MAYDQRQLRNQRTLQALRDSLQRLMSQQSYESIKAVDICREAKVHRTTFYLHYENKEHLLNDCVNQLKETIESRIIPSERTEIPSGYYAELLKQMVIYLDEHPRLQEGLVHAPSNQVFWLKLQDLIAHDVKKRMQRYSEKGYAYTVDLDMNAQFFTTGIIGTLLWWLRNHRPVPAELFYSQMAALMDPRKALLLL